MCVWYFLNLRRNLKKIWKICEEKTEDLFLKLTSTRLVKKEKRKKKLNWKIIGIKKILTSIKSKRRIWQCRRKSFCLYEILVFISKILYLESGDRFLDSSPWLTQNSCPPKLDTWKPNTLRQNVLGVPISRKEMIWGCTFTVEAVSSGCDSPLNEKRWKCWCGDTGFSDYKQREAKSDRGGFPRSINNDIV